MATILVGVIIAGAAYLAFKLTSSAHKVVNVSAVAPVVRVPARCIPLRRILLSTKCAPV